MNRENVLKAIAVMERAKARGSVCMVRWQGNNGHFPGGNPATDENSFHACGNSACFGGHIAVSPEFQGDGGCVGPFGMPVLGAANCDAAIRRWMEVSEKLANHLVYGDLFFREHVEFSTFYDKIWKDVTADDVLVKLHMILNGELT